jgi:hypothetical protein
MSNSEVQNRLLVACETDSLEIVLEKLAVQDERIYKLVHGFFEAEGMTIQALAGESTSDVVNVGCAGVLWSRQALPKPADFV